MIPELTAVYLLNLQIIANRFDWTIGVFIEDGFTYIELVKDKTERLYAKIITPSKDVSNKGNYRIADDTAKSTGIHILRSLDLRTPISETSQMVDAPV